MRSDRTPPSVRWNLRHLWAFCQVVGLKSISRASEAINLSQPAVSQGIIGLESSFGEALFHRTPSGMFATDAGEILDGRLRRGFDILGRSIERDGRQSLLGGEAGDVISVLFRGSQLSTLNALAETGSTTAAAAKLEVSEKSVTRTIRQFEHRVGRSLLLKDSGVTRLSQTGETIARAARIFFREIDLAREEIASVRGVSAGRLVIGGLPLARSFILPKAMVRFATDFPEMQVQLLEGAYETLLAGLRDGDVDIIVGALRLELDPEEFTQHPLFEEHLCVVARSDHPVFTSADADIFAWPWIAPRAGSPARRQFDEIMERESCHPRILMEVASHIAVRSVLIESDCCALLSRHQIRYEVGHGQLAVVPVTLNTWPRQIGYVVRAGWRPTTPQTSFLRELEAAVDQSLTDGHAPAA